MVALRDDRKSDVKPGLIDDLQDTARWRILGLVCAGIVLSMTTWFSATAIMPDMIRLWQLSQSQASWLTIAVQIGFVIGALGSSIVGLPDLVSLRKLMAVSAIVAALANLSLLFVPSIAALLLARCVTGIALAGVYPPALKLISTWFKRGRGLALGALIAALTLGSASPHLIRVLVGQIDWRIVVGVTSAATVIGGLVLWRFAEDGPFPFRAATFDPKQILIVLWNRPLALATVGYLGHMWELYAMWGWFLAYVGAAGPHIGLVGQRTASLVTFVVIGAGVVGAVLGGLLADRIGRTATAAIMMAVSATCALTIGFAFEGPTWLFITIAVVWGLSIIGDSAQFSAMATELSDSRYVGTALALQLGLGFLLTVVSIRLTPMVAGLIGWRWSLLVLVPGPVVGIGAMLLLRRRAEAIQIAGGLR